MRTPQDSSSDVPFGTSPSRAEDDSGGWLAYYIAKSSKNSCIKAKMYSLKISVMIFKMYLVKVCMPLYSMLYLDLTSN